MGNVVQLPERPSKVVDTRDDIGQINISRMSRKATREQISQTMATCETLRGTIVALKENLKTLDSVVRVIKDPEKREELERQLTSMRELLGMRLTELSGVELLLQASLRRVQQPKS